MTEEIQKLTNPLLARVHLPGETFRLPSQGLFYQNDELDPEVKNGEVHILPMTAYDEIIMKTPDMMFSGSAFKDVFARCIPQVKKPMDLLSKDVDYLLACMRLVTYGPTIDVSFKHNCENAKNHQYSIEVRPILKQAKAIDPTTLSSVFSVTLPNGQVVHLRPPVFGSVLEMYQSGDFTNQVATADNIERSIFKVLIDMIQSVDDITDRNNIEEWVKTISAGWVRLITSAVESQSDWGADFVVKKPCQDCGQDADITIVTNPISFFS